jgi:hypothetical protein
VIAVADRGLLSSDNLAELQAITLPGGGQLEFILAVPGRRYSEFIEVLEPLAGKRFACRPVKEGLAESRLERLAAGGGASSGNRRRPKPVPNGIRRSRNWRNRPRNWSRQAGRAGNGVKAVAAANCRTAARAPGFYHAVCEARLTRIIRVDLKSESLQLSHRRDKALAHARLMDGKLLLVTNVQDLSPARWWPATSPWRILSAASGC